MARDFSPITFFQRTPKALLGRYFQEKYGVLAEIAFDELEENGQTAEAIYEAFSALPEPQQAQIEAECQEIESMAHQAGVTALIDEATDFHKNAGFPEAINQQDSFHGKVMWTFLEYPNYWAGATSNLYAESIPDASWNKRNDLPHVPPHVEPEDTNRLADALSHYFRKKEGRGRHCRVDVYRKGNKKNFFAHLSDFGQADPEWEGNNLNPRARLPSFEIILCLYPVGRLAGHPRTGQHQVRGRPATAICRIHPQAGRTERIHERQSGLPAGSVGKPRV